MRTRGKTAPWRLALAVAPLAMAPAAVQAQPMSTASSAPSGISQEQALALSARLDALEKRNEELESRVAELKAEVAAGGKAAPGAAVTTISNGRPTFSTGDKSTTLALRGVFQLDAVRFDQDPPGPTATDFRRGSLGDATETDRARDLDDGTNFRRARIGLEGTAFGDWNYNFLYDFGGSGVEEPGKIINAWVEYAGFAPTTVRIGAFAPPSGIDGATNTQGLLFLERAAVAEMIRGIASGDGRKAIGLFSSGERWNLSAALTGNLVGTATFDHQSAVVARGAFLPLKRRNALVHLGANLTWVIDPAATGPDVPPGGAATPIRLRERPENRVDVTRLVDTGALDAKGLTAWGVEFAAQHGPLSVQSEYFRIDLERRTGALSDPDFAGWYLQGAWTITGQPRRYGAATATLDVPRVEKPFSLKSGDWGVWELAARYSDLDLNYQAGAPGTAPGASAVRGGRQQVVTLGLNWYPNPVVRFQADYQYVDVDRLSPGGTAFGAGTLTPPAGAQIGQELNIWSFRTQYAF